MTVRIIHGDARRLPLDDASVDLIVTSPPYWSLRSYTDGGEHYDGQIGSEPTPQEYVDNLIDCTREWMRVLKPTGSIFVNLGDKYQNQGGRNGHTALKGVSRFAGSQPVRRYDTDVPQKSLLGLPWRYALRCIDTTCGVPANVVRQMLNDVEAGLMTFAEARTLVAEYDHGGGNAGLGLILRAEVIWNKPNGLPESVTDRVRRSHEVWFHLVKQPRYYSAIDHIRQPHAGRTVDQAAIDARRKARNELSAHRRNEHDPTGDRRSVYTPPPNPLGALPGSVWEIATEPLQVPAHLGIDHFAAFPMEWPRRIILGWSPVGICTTCGEGRRPVTIVTRDMTWDERKALGEPGRQGISGHNGGMKLRPGSQVRHTITGEVCGCPDTSAPTRPSVVLDPFSGTGTTCLVAKALGRDAVGVDMSADYCRLAEWRTQDPGQLAKAMGVPKPPKELDGQASALDLLTELDGGAA